jgi:hypothetical protein
MIFDQSRDSIVAEYHKEVVDLARHVFGQHSSKSGLPLTEAEAPLPTPEVMAEDRSARTVPLEANSDPQILGPPLSRSDLAPPKPKTLQQANEVVIEASPDLTKGPEAKQTKTAEELAAMIETDLAKHPECPRSGFQVTVYGTTLWRAMLTIKPAAGPVRNPQEWRDLTEELADRLRRRYDLAWR